LSRREGREAGERFHSMDLIVNVAIRQARAILKWSLPMVEN
jgi:hypothetical protein